MVYLLIAVILLITAFFLIYNSSLALIQSFKENDFIQGALHVIDRVLLTLMIVEIIYTVKISLQAHTLTVKPFIMVGLIASIRRILIISVESAYMTERFQAHMIEMGVLGFIIIVLIFSLQVCKKKNI
ncbi:hypothetical protein DRI50_05020 [candidate division KSB1 bacterium]|nr:MAG: hypothetical protein DRI50_05020 [candidate division KSB1 bacterium]